MVFPNHHPNFSTYTLADWSSPYLILIMVEYTNPIFEFVESLGSVEFSLDQSEIISLLIEIETGLQSQEKIKLCIMANQMGKMALKAKSYDRAKSLLGKALQITETFHQPYPYTHLLYNLGNLHLAIKDHTHALEYYLMALKRSPYNNIDTFESFSDIEGLKFNSQSCYAHTLSNIAVIYLLISTGQTEIQADYNRCTLAAETCIKMALKAMPEGEGSEAYINMNNVMRQMGCKQNAFEYTWLQVAQSFGKSKFEKPQAIKCSGPAKHEFSPHLQVVCVKYGTKYGADYVNKLFYGVKTNLTLDHTFICFTDDPAGLDPKIKVIQLKHQWQGWWSKVHIFDSKNYQPNSRVFYIDLDMIITGDLTELATMPVHTLATLSTDEIFCENVDGGYNSSVMLFAAESLQILYDTIRKYYTHLVKYLMRFDHFLEMMVWDATLVQKALPGQVLDYVQTFKTEGKQDVPFDCRVIAFPRQPKPHEISDFWVEKFWRYQ